MCLLFQAAPLFGVGEQALLGLPREQHRLLPAGEGVEDEAGGERHAQPEGDGHREGDDPCAALGGVGTGPHPVAGIVEVPGGDREDVPVELAATGGQRHVGHQLDGPILVLAGHGQELDARAGELADYPAEFDELVSVCIAAGDHVAVGVVVGA